MVCSRKHDLLVSELVLEFKNDLQFRSLHFAFFLLSRQLFESLLTQSI